MSDRAPSHDRAAVLVGAAAIHCALDTIGREGSDDHALAKYIVDEELGIRALLKFALSKLVEEMGEGA